MTAAELLTQRIIIRLAYSFLQQNFEEVFFDTLIMNHQMKLHPVTLKFSGESSNLEKPFMDDYYKSSLSHVRMLVILGAVIYAAFGILDALLMPKQMFSIWIIRVFIIGPALIGFLLISFSGFFRRYMQPVLAFVFVLCGAGIIGMIVIAPPQVGYSYYAGLMLVFMWGYTLVRLFFVWASFAGWTQVILYEIASIWINPTPLDIFVGNNFFFIGANALGMMACYAIEFYARRDFFMKQQLEIERNNVSRINEELEERVRQRTMDYQIVNQELQQEIAGHKQAQETLKMTLESLKKSVSATIHVMVSAVEARDPYTAGHQIRSSDLAGAIAAEMGLSQDKIDCIRMAGAIHDIGKLSIPAEILTKPSKLTDLEFSLIKEHSSSGYEMLKHVESPWPLAQIVYQHHERIDGSGYPRKLKGEEILIEARILAVSDVVESMASHRPYRPSLGIEAALSEIEINKGILYDAVVADACLKLFRENKYRLA
jgi:HD-GYP domain-containing protein (c-di-GMP phosphodiesterase class II)/phage shock protein PspC (stress-responsive transcriptional regulator)